MQVLTINTHEKLQIIASVSQSVILISHPILTIIMNDDMKAIKIAIRYLSVYVQREKKIYKLRGRIPSTLLKLTEK